MYDAVIIGGGAAGMMAACTAARRGASVLLLEKNQQTGRKLGITGKGRCNLTNDCDMKTVISNTPTGGKFLYSALSLFSPEDTKSFFESIGVPVKTERGGRVFPISDRAADVVNALRREMDRSGVEVRRNAAVLDIVTEDGSVSAVKTQAMSYECRAAVLCTGGLSYPATGSTGDGYEIAKRLGHTVLPPKPSLVPLVSDDKDCARMQGLSLKNVGLAVHDGGKRPVYSGFGEMLFTHFGLSGPLILSASAHMRDFGKKKYYISIDLKPALDEKKLDARILRDFAKYSNRDFSNSLADLANRLMIPVLIDRSGIPADIKVHSITHEQRRRLVELFKDFRIDIAEPRPVDEAIITSGGISTKEINPKTMMSKLVKGLYFAGEIIDADAYTGGFNLQIAWSTAYAASIDITK